MDCDSESSPPKPKPATRHKCSACFKQYNKKEHLVEHMKVSYHSIHQPKCGFCKKHCRTFGSLREHLTGFLSKDYCSRAFTEVGCSLCLRVFDSPIRRSEHKWSCHFLPPSRLGPAAPVICQFENPMPQKIDGTLASQGHEVVALDCEMVGGGSDGSLNLCARVCLVDGYENVIFHTLVLPQMPVTDYRSDVTGLTEELLKDAMPIKEVQAKVEEILYNGESIGIARIDGGKARLLVGHSVDYDLDCLRISYPDHLIRDTAKYQPLMKTNLVSHSLKDLTKMYLGYDIQKGIHDPYEDAVSALRLYKKMRDQDHLKDFIGTSLPNHVTELTNEFEFMKPKDLESLTADELYDMSRSKYRCWCLDTREEVALI